MTFIRVAAAPRATPTVVLEPPARAAHEPSVPRKNTSLVEKVQKLVAKMRASEHFTSDEKALLAQWAARFTLDTATRPLVELLFDLVYPAMARPDQQHPDALEAFETKIKKRISESSPQHVTADQVIEDFLLEAQPPSAVVEDVIESLRKLELTEGEINVLSDWQAGIPLKTLDLLHDETSRKLASFSLCDLLVMGIVPVKKRVQNPVLVAAEGALRDLLLQTLPADAPSVDEYICGYEESLAELARKTRLQKIARCADQTLEHFEESLRELDTKKVEFFEEFKEQLQKKNSESRRVDLELQTILVEHHTPLVNNLGDQLVKLAAKSDQLEQEITTEVREVKQITEEGADVLRHAN